MNFSLAFIGQDFAARVDEHKVRTYDYAHASTGQAGRAIFMTATIQDITSCLWMAWPIR